MNGRGKTISLTGYAGLESRYHSAIRKPVGIMTKKDVYSLPRIDDALGCLRGAKLHSTMDLKIGLLANRD
ncbi:K02A2.6-like [Cordylochernes scorpioides]|uniref:K02A2.6-like n=1 Tax=Cordylochernes scorpioides TaxID=51811 RepID=A0ABY6KPP4_9ARAC|nr:K02A2.6-like [Cordylochernes scorpioides]